MDALHYVGNLGKYLLINFEASTQSTSLYLMSSKSCLDYLENLVNSGHLQPSHRQGQAEVPSIGMHQALQGRRANSIQSVCQKSHV